MKKSINTRIFFIKILYGATICCFASMAVAQNNKIIDSLKHIVANTENDSVKLKALAALNKINQNRNEEITGYNEQIELGTRLKEYGDVCDAYYRLGYFELENNNLTAAEALLQKCIKLGEQTNNYLVTGRCCGTLMSIYDERGDMNTAISYLNKAEQLMKKANKMVNLTRLYCNASELYRNHNLNAKALEYGRKAYATAQLSGDLEPMTTASWYLGYSLQIIGKSDSAIHFFLQGLQIAQKLEMPYTEGDMLRGLSDVYAELKEYSTARDYLNKAIVKYKSVNVPDRILECEESLAYLDFMNKDFYKVEKYMLIRKEKNIADSLKNVRYISKWLANLALVNNDVEGWKKNYNKYEQADAALTGEKIQKTILEIEAKYELSKKERALLQKDTENQTRLWIIAALAFVLLSIVVIAITQYKNFKNKQKIEIQNALIEKQEALEKERFRIAADMHDDMGAGLSRMRYLSAAMKNETQNEGLKKNLDNLIAGSDELVDKMNDIIWTLNSGDEKLEDALYYIRSQCSEILNNANINFECSLPDSIPPIMINSEQKRNLYLVIKEAVHNIIKHSGATKADLQVQINKQLKIIVADNGKGFDVEKNKLKGNGISNYQKRMIVLKGRFDIQSSERGTEVVFEIPPV
jgi:two-component system, NarL family, sensor kinase